MFGLRANEPTKKENAQVRADAPAPPATNNTDDRVQDLLAKMETVTSHLQDARQQSYIDREVERQVKMRLLEDKLARLEADVQKSRARKAPRVKWTTPKVEKKIEPVDVPAIEPDAQLAPLPEEPEEPAIEETPPATDEVVEETQEEGEEQEEEKKKED